MNELPEDVSSQAERFRPGQRLTRCDGGALPHLVQQTVELSWNGLILHTVIGAGVCQGAISSGEVIR